MSNIRKMKTRLVKNKETEKVQKILNFPEIRSGTFKTSMSASAVSKFKTGQSESLRMQHLHEFKQELNCLCFKIQNFTTQPVPMHLRGTFFSDKKHYFIEVLKISSIPQLNWHYIVNQIDTCKPNYSLLLWSYWKNKDYVNQEIISDYPLFFIKLKESMAKVQNKMFMA